MIRLSCVLALAFAAGSALAAESCLVVGISDGDTLTARCGEPGDYRQLKIRLAQIDAPEKAQPFGQRAKVSLSALCFGAWASIHAEAQDGYGRTVARVECHGQDANAEQVRRGMAWVYDRYAPKASPLYQVQAEARSARAGLWADKDPIAPWEWRRR